MDVERKESLQEININLHQRIVQIGIQFDRIGEIDTVNENFKAEVSIEAKWKENRVIKKYNPEKDWNPRLYIENSLQETKDLTRYYVENDETTNTCTITLRRIVRGIFWEKMELQNFPLDIQQLTITLTTMKSANEIKLVVDKDKKYFNMRVSKTFIDQQKWRLYKFIDMSEQASYEFSSSFSKVPSAFIEPFIDMPKLCASCYASRRPSYYLWNAYFLIFLNTIVSFNIFAIDNKPTSGRLSPAFTLLLTSITFKWVVNRSLPAVGYLTALDKYEIASIFYLCLVSIWHAIAGACWEPKQLEIFEKWIVFVFAVLFIILQLSQIGWSFYTLNQLKSFKEKERKFLEI